MAKELVSALVGGFIRDDRLIPRPLTDEERATIYSAVRELADERQRREDAERRAFTRMDIDLIQQAINILTTRGGDGTADALSKLLARIDPPNVVWHRIGCVSAAEFNRWSLCVRPGLQPGVWIWSVTIPDCVGENNRAITREAAEAAAEKWARENGR